MTLFLHETKQNRLAFLIWTFSIALMLLICMMMFPEINTGMEDMNDMFANMGSFTQAFGMDRLNFGDVMGFYAIECGNILSIGGGFFAALLGINALAKEEKERTAACVSFAVFYSHPDLFFTTGIDSSKQIIDLPLSGSNGPDVSMPTLNVPPISSANDFATVNPKPVPP